MSRIVVGVDGSPVSIEALRWAIDEAKLRGGSVDAVHVWTFPIVAGPLGAVIPTIPREDLEGAAREVLEEVLGQVEAGEVEVRPQVFEGGPGPELVRAAEGADLLVVGSRGHGGFAGLLLGSVSHQAVHRASCPVVVIPAGRQGARDEH